MNRRKRVSIEKVYRVRRQQRELSWRLIAVRRSVEREHLAQGPEAISADALTRLKKAAKVASETEEHHENTKNFLATTTLLYRCLLLLCLSVSSRISITSLAACNKASSSSTPFMAVPILNSDLAVRVHINLRAWTNVQTESGYILPL